MEELEVQAVLGPPSSTVTGGIGTSDTGGAAEKGQQALLLFANSMAAQTAVLLSNARLEDQPIQVMYFFTEFRNTGSSNGGTAGGNERETQVSADQGDRGSSFLPTHTSPSPRQANRMASEWLAQSMLLTEQVVLQGRTWLGKAEVDLSKLTANIIANE